MKRSYFLLLLFCILSLYVLNAQTKETTNQFKQYKKTIQDLKEEGQYEKALLFAKNYYDSINKDETVFHAKIMLLLSEMYFKNNKQDSTKLFATSALKIGRQLKSDYIINHSNLILASIYYQKFENEKAIDLYTQIIKIAEKKNIKNNTLMRAFINKGKLLLRTYSVTDTSYIGKAENYYKKAIQVAKEINDPDTQHHSYRLIGGIYGQRKEYDTALKYLHLSYNYFQKTNNEKELADVCQYFGIIYNYKQNIELAKKFYEERYKILSQEKYPLNQQARANWSMGAFHKKFNNYEYAIPYFKNALRLFQESKTEQIAIEQSIFKDLAFCNKQLRNYKKSNQYYEKALSYQDSLIKNLQVKSTLELETKYQTEKKEQEITLLSAQNNFANLQKKNQRNSFLIALLFALIGSAFLLYLYKNKVKTNRKLLELDKAKSTFFTNISHEFRTPLTLISGPIKNILNKKVLKDQDQLNLEIVDRNTQNLLTLVDQLLEMSKIEASNFKLNITKSPLIPLVESIIKGFEFSAEQKNIKYHTTILPSSSETWFDRNSIEKIISNLVTNALKYTPKNGNIDINFSIIDNAFKFEIINTGKGLTESELGQIFKRFYQNDSNNPGVGIGLSLVKELISLHKGSINVQSIYNKNTCFKISIPIHKNAYEIAEQTTTHSEEKIIKEEFESISQTIDTTLETKMDSQIVLIVEDNQDLINYIKSLFSDQYTVLLANDGQQGINMALKHIPDIIISDIMMPVKTGIALCNTLKTNELTSHVPIILLTAKAGDENVLKGIETGADHYITKPFNEEVLMLKVKQTLKTRQQLRDRYSQELILKPTDLAINSTDETFLNKVQTILETRLTEPDFNIDEFSSFVNMSRIQLYRKLKSLTGLSASEFIRSERLKLAAQLLKKSDANISQICYTVGFNDPAYFSKCFKDTYNCTPSQFIKQ